MLAGAGVHGSDAAAAAVPARDEPAGEGGPGSQWVVPR